MYHHSQIAAERDKGQIPARIQNCSANALCVAVLGAVVRGKKMEFDSNPRIKINAREFNATQGVMEQRLLGGLVLFSYGKQYSSL